MFAWLTARHVGEAVSRVENDRRGHLLLWTGAAARARALSPCAV